MERKDSCSKEVDRDSCGSFATGSPEMDQNPYPPPEEVEAEAGEEADAIGETMYSKHWLFNTLTLLIQMMTDQEFGHSDALVELLDELEEDLYKVWDMAMDKFQMEHVVMQCGCLYVRLYVRIYVSRTTLLSSCMNKKLFGLQRPPCCLCYTPAFSQKSFYVEYCQRTGGNPESERSHKEEGKDEEEETDVQLKALIETTADFLSVLIMDLAKVQHLVGLLSEVEPKLADIIKKDISISSNM